MPIIDGHIDIAWNYWGINRSFLDAVDIKRSKEPQRIQDIEGIATVGLPELKKADVRVVFGTIWVETADSVYPSLGKQYRSVEEAKEYAEQQFGYYTELDSVGEIILVRSYQQIEKIFASKEYVLGIVPIIEGADFITSQIDYEHWIYQNNIRIVAPIWQKNQFGGCCELGGGLTQLGRSLARQLEADHRAIDIAHMSDASISDTLNVFNGTIINTHTACRSIVPGERNISDWQIRMIAEREGVIGLMPWKQKISALPKVSIDKYIDQMVYITDLVGSCDNVAIGTSLDGGYGREALPEGCDDISFLKFLDEKLRRRGFSDIDVEKILCRNWNRVLFKLL